MTIDPLGFLVLDGLEVAHAARTLTYLRRGLAGPGWTVYTGHAEIGWGNVADPREIDCVCEHVVRGPYTTPEADGAPWHDPAVPASAEFLGLLPLRIEVTGGAYRGVTPLRSGQQLTGLSRQGRTATVSGDLMATTARGVDFGEAWLKRVLAGLDACALPTLQLLPSCPGGDLLGAEGNFDTNTLDGWEQAPGSVGVMSTPTVPDAYSGSRHLLVTNTTGATQTVTTRTMRTGPYLTVVDPDARYTAFIAVRGDDRTTGVWGTTPIEFVVLLEMLTGAGTVITQQSRAFTLQGGGPWTYLAVTTLAATATAARVSVQAIVPPGGRYGIDHVRLVDGPDPVLEMVRVGLTQPVVVGPSLGRTCMRPVTFQLGSESGYLAHLGTELLTDQQFGGDGPDVDTGAVFRTASVGTESVEVEVRVHPSTTTGVLEDVEVILYEDLAGERIDPVTSRHLTVGGVVVPADSHPRVSDGAFLHADGSIGYSPQLVVWRIDSLPYGVTAHWDPVARRVRVVDVYGVDTAGWEGMHPLGPLGSPMFDVDPDTGYVLGVRSGGFNLLSSPRANFESATAGLPGSWGVLSPWGGAGGFGSQIEHVTSAARFGLRSMQMRATAAGLPYMYVDHVAHEIAPGQRYTFSGFVRRAGGTARGVYAQIIFVGPSGATTTAATGPTVTESGTVTTWSRFNVTGIAAAGTTHAILRITILLPANGELHFVDDLWFRAGYRAGVIGTSGGGQFVARRRLLVP